MHHLLTTALILFPLVLRPVSPANGAEPADKRSAWRIEPQGPWTVQGEVKGLLDVSGAAMLGDRHGLLVSDETRAVQRFDLDRAARRIVMRSATPLLPGKKPELDLEGIAASPKDGCYYATGSHSVARKTAEAQADRRQVFRIPADAATGALNNRTIARTTLVPVLESEAALKNSLAKKSDDGGVDIEGLAERDGTLFFGLRAPCIEGRAFIIEVKAAELFADASKAAHTTHRLALGAGFGIRDLARVSDGFLLIAGPSGTEETARGFTLHHWAGPGGALTLIGRIPSVRNGKAEGLLVLAENADDLNVLIFFDGALNGAPVELRLIKPKLKPLQ